MKQFFSGLFFVITIVLSLSCGLWLLWENPIARGVLVTVAVLYGVALIGFIVAYFCEMFMEGDQKAQATKIKNAFLWVVALPVAMYNKIK